MRVRTYRMHGIDTKAHLIGIDVRPHAVTEIEDMPGAVTEVREHGPDLGVELLGWGIKGHGIEIPL